MSIETTTTATPVASRALVRRLFATSVLRQSSANQFNHVVGYREAANSDEAIGLAIKASESVAPRTQLVGVNVCEIPREDIERFLASNTSGEPRRS